MNTVGLYLHLPFCDGKCPYCDFYSRRPEAGQIESYVIALCAALEDWKEKEPRAAHSLFLGGGTPSLLTGEQLTRLLAAARRFGLTADAEITCEANPRSAMEDWLAAAAAAGVNRLSFGLQSAHADELALLGRRHTAQDAARALDAARRAGIGNLSVDLMLCLPGQTPQKAVESVDFCLAQGVEHLSAYMLKVEEDTPFARQGMADRLPDEETQRAIYLAVCDRLEQAGLKQYEISNFARPGRECRHNLTYWDDGEYLGLGPAAHSFLHGKRFYWSADTAAFCTGAGPTDDGDGGDWDEYLMLRLRLRAGLTEAGARARFGHGIPPAVRRRAAPLAAAGWLTADADGLRLTREGALVSNAVITALLDD